MERGKILNRTEVSGIGAKIGVRYMEGITMGELLLLAQRLSFKLQSEICIERTGEEIGNGLMFESNYNLQRALFLAEGYVNDELPLAHLVEMTAPFFSREK